MLTSALISRASYESLQPPTENARQPARPVLGVADADDDAVLPPLVQLVQELVRTPPGFHLAPTAPLPAVPGNYGGPVLMLPYGTPQSPSQMPPSLEPTLLSGSPAQDLATHLDLRSARVLRKVGRGRLAEATGLRADFIKNVEDGSALLSVFQAQLCGHVLGVVVTAGSSTPPAVVDHDMLGCQLKAARDAACVNLSDLCDAGAILEHVYRIEAGTTLCSREYAQALNRCIAMKRRSTR